MGDLPVLALAFYAALAAIVATGSWIDVRSRRIPNWLCAANLGLGFGYTGLAYDGGGAGWAGVGLAALHVLVALLVTMGLFALGMIGAGDAKFYASMAAWMPIQAGLWLLTSVSLAGLALLALFFAFRIRGRTKRNPEQPSDFDKLPFGVAIGIGGLMAVLFG